MQRFQAVAQWLSEVFKLSREMEHVEFSLGDPVKGYIQYLSRCFGVFLFENVICSLVPKRSDHSLPSPLLYHYTTKWNKYMKTHVMFLLFLLMSAGCVSRAPTDCELDKRSGMYPSSFCDKEEAKDGPRPSGISTSRFATDTKPALPIREEAKIARIWVSDQKIDGGHWMQGTWIFVEIEGSRWSGESVSSFEISESQRSLNPPAKASAPIVIPTPTEKALESSRTRHSRGNL
jgi:hypothetical protein